jgi:hypothetical protein
MVDPAAWKNPADQTRQWGWTCDGGTLDAKKENG